MPKMERNFDNKHSVKILIGYCTMKAVIYRDYGTAGELNVTEMPRPEPAKGEILIRNHAAGVNPIDARLRRGEMKMMLPGGFPRIPGFDVAGVVQTVNGTGEFQAGDRVMTFLQNLYGGAYAEYSICKSSNVVIIPDTMTFEDAAALPLAGSTAIQSLRDHGKLEPDDRVLVIGATGGVGAFAVQIAKAYGCSVDGVAAGMHESFAHEIGVEQFINYEKERVFPTGSRMGLDFRCSGKKLLSGSEIRSLIRWAFCHHRAKFAELFSQSLDATKETASQSGACSVSTTRFGRADSPLRSWKTKSSC